MAQNIFVQQLIVDANNNYNSFNINHLNLILMYKVTKETINFVGNVIKTEFIAFVNIGNPDEFDDLIRSYHGRALADNQVYIIRGQVERVRYVLTPINVLASSKARVDNIKAITDTINKCNSYIKELNAAAKRSAKLNSKKDIDLRQYVNVKEYWMHDKQDYVKQNYEDELYIY